jgi:hypothetical protein
MVIEKISADMRNLLPIYIAQHLNLPFEWGHNDCICFVVGWIEFATGFDYLSSYKWASAKEAAELIKNLGGIEKMFNEHLEKINPNYAKDGDIALIDHTAFLFCGSRIVSVGKNGLVFKNRLEASCAWSF